MHAIIRLSGRGELHSPNNNVPTELHSPDNGRGELHSPNNNSATESYSPDNNGVTELHSPNNNDTTELHSPNQTGVCKTPLRSPTQTVGAIVRGYKSSVTRQLGLMGFDEKLWQRNYFERIIRDEQSYQTISEYIINNPAKWTNDTFFK